VTDRVFAQTMADGRYEWQRASSVWERVMAVLKLGGALARVLAVVIWTDAWRAAETSFVRRWIAGTTLLSVSLWAGVPLLRRVHEPHFYLVDLGQIFMTLMMPAFLLLALTRRREAAVPRLGTLAVTVGTLLAWFLILIPLSLAARYTAWYHDHIYVPVPWVLVLQWLVVATALAWASLGLADRVIVHERRQFLTVLSLLVPALLAVLAARVQSGFAPLWVAWRVAPYTACAAAAATGVAMLWAGLVFESRAEHQGSVDALR